MRSVAAVIVVLVGAMVGTEFIAAGLAKIGIIPNLNLLFVLAVCGIVTVVIVMPWLRGYGTRRAMRRELAALQGEIERLRAADPLTGLPNRTALLAVARKVVADTPAEIPVALLAIDIDRFRTINDLAGSEAGDAVLRAVGASIAATTAGYAGVTDHAIGRVGGDEFAAVVTGLDHKQIAQLAGRITDEVRRVTHVHGGTVLNAAVTIGIAMRSHGQDLDAMLRTAAQAIETARNASHETPARMKPPADFGVHSDHAVHALRTAAKMAYGAQRRDEPRTLRARLERAG
jgi:diguanylate cyclase (GGDEF)-like protein